HGQRDHCCRDPGLEGSVVIGPSGAVFVDEIGDFKRCKAGIMAAATCCSAWAMTLLIQNLGDLRINVVIEKLIDQFNDTGLCLDLLSGGFWVHGGERLDFAALEANVKLGGSFRRQL
ncbi:hypothetical protein, partial [Rhizobium johnstonii]|uniref:hypothetical protein n=1 Tax=Rhizobium johnstonii TaxID=3019933 RepID=UPI003F9D66D0